MSAARTVASAGMSMTRIRLSPCGRNRRSGSRFSASKRRPEKFVGGLKSGHRMRVHPVFSAILRIMSIWDWAGRPSVFLVSTATPVPTSRGSTSNQASQSLVSTSDFGKTDAASHRPVRMRWHSAATAKSQAGKPDLRGAFARFWTWLVGRRRCQLSPFVIHRRHRRWRTK